MIREGFRPGLPDALIAAMFEDFLRRAFGKVAMPPKAPWASLHPH